MGGEGTGETEERGLDKGGIMVVNSIKREGVSEGEIVREVACKYCESRTIKAGYVLRAGIGKVQRQQCVNCGRYTIDDKE